jgi:hypothetical protein
MDPYQLSSSSTLRGKFRESTEPVALQFVDTPDLWQAPVNFEWDQWEAYIERFPGESLGLNGA